VKTLTQVQDKLIATLVKCYRTGKAKGYFPNAWGCKNPAVRTAQNKCEKELVAMGYTGQQAYRAMLDACDVAKLQVECE
jgi:hypothetical protein